MDNRWFDFGGDAIVRTDRCVASFGVLHTYIHPAALSLHTVGQFRITDQCGQVYSSDLGSPVSKRLAILARAFDRNELAGS